MASSGSGNTDSRENAGRNIIVGGTVRSAHISVLIPFL